MAYSKDNIQSVYEISKFLKKENALPVYFFCGTDTYTIENAVKTLLNSLSELVQSEFDKEIINLEKKASLAQILDLAYAFPFGGGKKMLVVNEFQNADSKKNLVSYILNPSESTILIITQPDKIANFSVEPYKTLNEKGYVFQADELKGPALISWVKKQVERKQRTISTETASLLVDLVGEDKSLLEMQIIKLIDYSDDNSEIFEETIADLTSKTKEFSIFDLQDSISAGDRAKAFEVVENLIEKGNDISFIIGNLSKYVLTVTQAKEIKSQFPNDFEASKKIGVSKYYYLKCKNARYLTSFERLKKAAGSLLQADIRVKTSAMNPKYIADLLIAEIFENDN